MPKNFSTGILSPVNVDSSTDVIPWMTWPSNGIFSPGRTSTMSPTEIFSISMHFSSLSTNTFAFKDRISSSFCIVVEVFPLAMVSINFPSRTKVIMSVEASKYVEVLCFKYIPDCWVIRVFINISGKNVIRVL